MRNDTHDELEVFSGLRAEVDDDRAVERFDEPVRESQGRAVASPPVARSASGTGLLWALVVALLISLGGLGWWSHSQISLMSAQLVATQESFARISEEAAGRIQDITGKVVATESSVTSESESLKLRIKQLETRQAELLKQQQTLTQGQAGQDKQLQQLAVELKGQQGGRAQTEAQLKKLASEQASLKTEQASLKAAQGGTGKLESQLAGLNSEVAALKKADVSQAVRRLEQDLLVLRSELDNRPAAAQGPATAEFDAFRAQMTRNINTLQSQVQNLQQQLDAR